MNQYENDIKSPGLIKDETRAAIKESSGDMESLLGTTADGMQVILHAFSAFIVKLNSAQSLDEVRASTNDFAPAAQQFLKKVESKQVKLPFEVRGMDETMAKIENRATAVANVLAAKA